MYIKKTPLFSRAVVSAAIATSILSIGASSSYARSEAALDRARPHGALVVADAHSYRHCHNLSKRSYCHTADKLPQNWPPNTETPHRGGTGSNSRKHYPLGSTACPSNLRSRRG